jgi:hypothetical protein
MARDWYPDLSDSISFQNAANIPGINRFRAIFETAALVAEPVM